MNSPHRYDEDGKSIIYHNNNKQTQQRRVAKHLKVNFRKVSTDAF